MKNRGSESTGQLKTIVQVPSPSGIHRNPFFYSQNNKTESKEDTQVIKGSMLERQPTRIPVKSLVLSPFKKASTPRVNPHNSTHVASLIVMLRCNDTSHFVQLAGELNSGEMTAKLKLILQKQGIRKPVLYFATCEQSTNLMIDYLLSLPSQRIQLKQRVLHLKTVFKRTIRNNNQRVTHQDFNLLKCIGLGGFSRVYAARKQDDGKFYAIKLVDKQFIKQHSKQIVIEHERQILSTVDSPFLTSLHYAFEGSQYIAFVMDYCSGGELFFHLRRLRRLSEAHARFYFVQICLAVQYLHKHGVLYRDIKPENILMTLDGYLQISDFGLSKPTTDVKNHSYSFCGSPEYMAPEMLQRKGHNFMVDCYCLGALLYEFVVGLPPFYSRNTNEIYQSILSEDIILPSYLSSPLQDLIYSLLQKDPRQRLGCKNGVDDILDHPWVRQIDINTIIRKEEVAPYLPDRDSFNFDENDFNTGDTEFREKYYSTLDQPITEVMFPNFYFERQSPRLASSCSSTRLLRQLPTKSQHSMPLWTST